MFTAETTKSSYAGNGRNTNKAVVQGIESTVRKSSFMDTGRTVRKSCFEGCGADNSKKWLHR
jgi:hypothetical protein